MIYKNESICTILFTNIMICRPQYDKVDYKSVPLLLDVDVREMRGYTTRSHLANTTIKKTFPQ